MVKILSWNTLESGPGGAWSNGWGCPLEIRRRDQWIQTLTGEDGLYQDHEAATAEAERLLTMERYQRIRTALLEELLLPTTPTAATNEDEDHATTTPIDFLLFQECTAGDFWAEPSLDSRHEDSLDEEFVRILEDLYEKAPCGDQEEPTPPGTALQHTYFRRHAGWKPSRSIVLRSDGFAGGCLVEFTRSVCSEEMDPTGEMCSEEEEDEEEEKVAPSLVLVNLHGKARLMRDPHLRFESISELWEEIRWHSEEDRNGGNLRGATSSSSWNQKMVLCGDWNTQLSDLVEPFRRAMMSSSDSAGRLEPVVGMLDNATATTKDEPFSFSTNHEDGFLAQYDGCLLFRATPESSPGVATSYLELEHTSRNLTGFMPKGRNGKLSGESRPEAAAPVPNNFTYNRHHAQEGVLLNGMLLPGTKASMGMSDHLRIYTTIKVHGDRHYHKNGNETGSQL